LNPCELAYEIKKIVTKQCNCETSWVQQEGDVTAAEYAAIYTEVTAFVLKEREKAITQEHAAHDVECKCDECTERLTR
jgi:hypothetical protein